jgi:hypothetical protein
MLLRTLARRGLGLAFAAFVLRCSTDTGTGATTPLSQQCAACLSGTDSGTGCGTEFGACSRESACTDVVRCELLNHCYEQPADGSCASEVGCHVANDAGGAEQLRAAFEACARTTCASECGFVAP